MQRRLRKLQEEWFPEKRELKSYARAFCSAIIDAASVCENRMIQSGVSRDFGTRPTFAFAFVGRVRHSCARRILAFARTKTGELRKLSLEDYADRQAGRPFRAISSICAQNRSSSPRVVYKLGVMRMP